MYGVKSFSDDFNSSDLDNWYISDFVVGANWNQTGWNATYVDTATPGEVTLNFDGADTGNKPFTGAELQSSEFFGYGTYTVDMIASGESGVVSTFFLFTSEFYGAERHNEIDIEFLGGDTTVMNINYIYGGNSLGAGGSVQVPLGFDAADGYHTYTIEWQPDSIRWYADNILIHEIDAATTGVPIPDEAMKIYTNIWTGDEELQHWHGPVDDNAVAEASYSAIGYQPYVINDSAAGGDAVSFAGHAQGVVVDMAAGHYMEALKVLPIGDSLTLGAVNTNIPEDDATRDGYRFDLFERIVAGGGWVDYVGGLSNGPEGFLDHDHHGVGGLPLGSIVDDTNGPSHLSRALQDYDPDITLFMAGTNDLFSNGDSSFLDTSMAGIIADIETAVAQFYAEPGSENRYLIVSTLPPKAKGAFPEDHNFVNKGYSMVDGVAVPGDAGNGTYVPGILATIESLRAQHPTLIAFENPVTDISQMTFDLIHISEHGYQDYAAAMFATLEQEIGLTNGAFSSRLEALPTAIEVIGGEGGDRIGGDGASNILRGEGGNDFLEGRAGADTIWGGAGNDTIRPGNDNDTDVMGFVADHGDDIIRGFDAGEWPEGGNDAWENGEDVIYLEGGSYGGEFLDAVADQTIVFNDDESTVTINSAGFGLGSGTITIHFETEDDYQSFGAGNIAFSDQDNTAPNWVDFAANWQFAV